jgi:hypothetical protein
VGSKRKTGARDVREFTAILGGASGERPSVEIPFDVRSEYGAARAKVIATVKGVKLRTTVAVYGGKSYIGFRKEIREAAGIAIGEKVTVQLEPDREERAVEVPGELAAALNKDARAKAVFDALSFTHRREYAQWIALAKKAETRERRVKQSLEMLRKGTKHP